jgi:iron complex outermembrane receptor protein
MSLQDLEIAKNRLKITNATLVIVKDKKIIFESNSKGISDLVKAIEFFKKELFGSSAADIIIGKAAALLFIYARLDSVFAKTMSKSAMLALKNSNIKFEYEKIVPRIMNKEKNDICPFEKLVIDCSSPTQAYEKIKSFLGFY